MLSFNVFWIIVRRSYDTSCYIHTPPFFLDTDNLGSDWSSHRQVRLQARLGNMVCTFRPSIYLSISLFVPELNESNFICPLYFRLYQVFYGLMVCPWYAYSQTMISEVSPLPQMYVRLLDRLAPMSFKPSESEFLGFCSSHYSR